MDFEKKKLCHSGMEAENIMVPNASQDIQWLLSILNDLELPQTLPIIIYENNIPCIKLAENEKKYYHGVNIFP